MRIRSNAGPCESNRVSTDKQVSHGRDSSFIKKVSIINETELQDKSARDDKVYTKYLNGVKSQRRLSKDEPLAINIMTPRYEDLVQDSSS